MENTRLDALRDRIDEINQGLLVLLSERAHTVQEIGLEKEKQGVPKFDPLREKSMLESLVSHNTGPFDDDTIRHLFKQIFQASLTLQQTDHKKQLLVSRKRQHEDTIIQLGTAAIGGSKPIMIAGPCSIESYEQVRM